MKQPGLIKCRANGRQQHEWIRRGLDGNGEVPACDRMNELKKMPIADEEELQTAAVNIAALTRERE